MNKLLKAFLLIFYTSISWPTLGQNYQAKPINKGEVVPNFQFTTNVNGKESIKKISDYKKKLLIFEFFSIFCPTCIDAIPNTLRLQKEFEKDIQFIYVTKDSYSDLIKLWGEVKNWSGKAANIVSSAKELPFILQDSLLHQSFYHEGWGTQVWIDQKQTYRYLCYSETTNSENLQNFLTGKPVKLSEQLFAAIDQNDPLTWLKTMLDHLESYSFVMNRIENGSKERNLIIKYDSVFGKVERMNIFNSNLLNLYKIAYFNNHRQPDSKVLILCKDSAKIYKTTNSTQNWSENNSYCYALKIPRADTSDYFLKMRKDLDSYFSFSSKLEKRILPVFVLKQTEEFHRMKFNGIEKVNTRILQNDCYKYVLRNQDISNLTNLIDAFTSSRNRFIPFIDETNYKGNINIDLLAPLTKDKKSYEILRQSLHSIGLDLALEKREMEVLVIDNKK